MVFSLLKSIHPSALNQGLFASTVIAVKALHFAKTPSAMPPTELGILMDVKELHPSYPLIVDYQYYILKTVEK